MKLIIKIKSDLLSLIRNSYLIWMLNGYTMNLQDLNATHYDFPCQKFTYILCVKKKSHKQLVANLLRCIVNSNQQPWVWYFFLNRFGTVNTHPIKVHPKLIFDSSVSLIRATYLMEVNYWYIIIYQVPICIKYFLKICFLDDT